MIKDLVGRLLLAFFLVVAALGCWAAVHAETPGALLDEKLAEIEALHVETTERS